MRLDAVSTSREGTRVRPDEPPPESTSNLSIVEHVNGQHVQGPTRTHTIVSNLLYLAEEKR
jgi:hypothetical protein